MVTAKTSRESRAPSGDYFQGVNKMLYVCFGVTRRERCGKRVLLPTLAADGDLRSTHKLSGNSAAGVLLHSGTHVRLGGKWARRLHWTFLVPLIFGLVLLLIHPRVDAAATDCIDNATDGMATCTKPIYGPFVYGECVNSAGSSTVNAEGICNTQSPITSDSTIQPWMQCQIARDAGACSVPVVPINSASSGLSA